MRDAFASQLILEARKNPDIILVTGDLGYGVFDDFEKNFQTNI